MSEPDELPEHLVAKLRITIPGYELLNEIASGGQATVYRARELTSGLTVAIKVLHGGPLADESSRQRLIRETASLKALNHPNIVCAIESGRTPIGLDYLVMNYVDGRPLDAVWNDAAFAAAVAPEPPARLRLFKKICDVVQAAHLKGITHRDLSPSNILIDPTGAPHLLDFGLASTAFNKLLNPAGTSVSLNNQFLGKLQYAAPEQVTGGRDAVDIRTDVYAMGVILYQILTDGVLPYEVGDNLADTIKNIIHTRPLPPSDILAAHRISVSPRNLKKGPPLVNPTIEAIVLRALEKQKAERYQSAGEFAADIEQYLAGRSTVAQVRRDPTLIAAGWKKSAVAALLLALFLAAGILGWQRLTRQASVTTGEKSAATTLPAAMLPQAVELQKAHIEEPSVSAGATRPTEAPPPATPLAARAVAGDPLQPGREFISELGSNSLRLTIQERHGDNVIARFDAGTDITRIVSGSVRFGAFSWLAKDVQPIRGDRGDDYSAVVKDETLEFEFRDPQTQASRGQFTLRPLTATDAYLQRLGIEDANSGRNLWVWPEGPRRVLTRPIPPQEWPQLSAALNDTMLVYCDGESGTDATVEQLARLPKLQVLGFWEQPQVTDVGIAALRNNQSLLSLSLRGTHTTGKCIADVATIRHLETLHLGDGLCGARSLAPLCNCRVLHISFGKVSDDDLMGLAGHPTLSDISMEPEYGSVTSRCADALSSISCLVTLHLRWTDLDDDGFIKLAKLPSLRELDVPIRSVHSRGLASLPQFKHLSNLRLPGRKDPFTDDDLAAIGAVTGLKWLDFSDTSISDTQLNRVSTSLRNLGSVDLQGSPVTKKGLEALLRNCPELWEVNCPRTKISPDEINALRQTYPKVKIRN